MPSFCTYQYEYETTKRIMNANSCGKSSINVLREFVGKKKKLSVMKDMKTKLVNESTYEYANERKIK